MPGENKIPSLKAFTLTGNLELSPEVHLISFQRQFEFEPGQVIKIGLDSSQPPRIYSICSGNQDADVSVLFNIKKDGLLTPRLASMIPGEKILASEPYGTFKGTHGPAWWIAAGTGIAPFYSMFRSGMGGNKVLIHGASYLNQFYFEDELQEAFAENYIRCCSRESSCDTFPGRINKYLSQVDKFPDVKYYICGKALMVVEVRDLLIEKGISFENIIAEIYF